MSESEHEVSINNVSRSDVKENCQWAMGAHLSVLCGFIIPFGNLLGPFIIWQLKKDIPYIADHAKEALNFQITLFAAYIVAGILTIVLIGFLLLPILFVGSIILTIIAAIKANSDEDYEYPLTFRLIS